MATIKYLRPHNIFMVTGIGQDNRTVVYDQPFNLKVEARRAVQARKQAGDHHIELVGWHVHRDSTLLLCEIYYDRTDRGTYTTTKHQ